MVLPQESIQDVEHSASSTEELIEIDVKIEIKEEPIIDSYSYGAAKNLILLDAGDLPLEYNGRLNENIKQNLEVPFVEENVTPVSEGTEELRNENEKRKRKHEEKVYEKLLGTAEKLFVYLQSEDLQKLQESYKEEQLMTRCASCSYVTTSKQRLIIHMNSHRKKTKVTVKCPHCSFICLYKSYMKKHIRMIHKTDEVKKFKCDKCTFENIRKETVMRHQRNIHSEKRKLYKCPLCPFQTAYKNNLKFLHLLTHKNDEESKNFHCAHCSYKTQHKGTLVKHLITHSAQDRVVMFKCDKCPYQTKHKDSLRKHKLIHENVDDHNMFKCDLCPYQAKIKGYLTLHKRRNHLTWPEVKMNKCEKCSYQCKTLNHLKRHNLTHTNIKYQCATCDFKTKFKTDMVSHQKTVHRAVKKNK